ncbi:MAG TPA: Fic family protein [Oligoflexus sp.]|uniref:Fic family protein n=1 Tax=Oligoflexus sp. TaxID=1971216 RepID=UPI002D7F582C|nr:Fic family protein [Oligoflexus sp.]HET9236218.1 Fic family protein [Oligoflexus sp.]
MTPLTKQDIEGIILNLFSWHDEINIHLIAGAAGLSSANVNDRRAIQRALKRLLDQGKIEARGQARARSYISAEPINHEVRPGFAGIPLSQASESLLNYVSQPMQARIPTGYSKDFLGSYQPNRTYYLSENQRSDLLKIGRIENRDQPAGTYARTILNRLLIDLSWNSSRLEGNTYSLLETKRLIEFGENATGKDASEAQMILNHKEAIEYIVESAVEEPISAHTICSVHALLSDNLLGDPGASGRVRQILVGVSGTTYIPLSNPHLLQEMFQVFTNKLNLIKDPFEQSFFSLVHLSYLQAFEDVNKRTARMVSNIPLIKKNLNPLSFADVDRDAYITALLGIYEKNDVSLLRDLYLWAYKRSAQRYSAIQEAMGEPNILKMKFRSLIHEIVRTIILQKLHGSETVEKIKNILEETGLSESERSDIFKIVETEILSLHAGNIARFKVRPSEFQEWESQSRKK